MKKNSSTHTIDASGRTLGRVASEAAFSLRGKNSPSFAPHKLSETRVEIVNINKLNISVAKGKTNVYRRYTGYPGGLKEMTLEERIAKRGLGEAMRKTIYRMLPKNKLRPKMMKHLVIK